LTHNLKKQRKMKIKELTLKYRYPSTGAVTYWSDLLNKEFHSPSKGYFTSYFTCDLTKSQVKRQISMHFAKFSLRMGKPFYSRSGKMIWEAKVNER
jgi:hypothetical protein